MRDAKNPPQEPIASLGLLGTQSNFLPIPADQSLIQLSRNVGDDIEYVAPPQGHGLGLTRWERDQLPGTDHFYFKIPTSEIQGLISLRHWQQLIANHLPEHAITDRKAPIAKMIAEFCRHFLTFIQQLHSANWRAGLLHPDNIYVNGQTPTRMFFPDLGFAWVGSIELTKPFWLRQEDSDHALWNEERKYRQYSAPEHYFRKHPQAIGQGNLPDVLRQRDLHTVAELLAFLMTGEIGASAPPLAHRCPIWQVILSIRESQYMGPSTAGIQSAEQMKENLLVGLKAPADVVPLRATGQSQPVRSSGKQWVLLAMFLLFAGIGIAVWWYWPKPVEIVGSSTEPTTPSTEPVANSPPSPPEVAPPEPGILEKFLQQWQNAASLIEKAKAAIELAKVAPNNPAIQATRSELLQEIRKNFALAREGQHVPLESRQLMDLFQKLPAPTEAPSE